MPHPRVVLDANILYSETLTDVFVALAEARLVTVCWSDRVREEWLLALARNRPELAPGWVKAREAQMAAAQNWTRVAIDDAVLEQLQLPDYNDRHVLAAAIAARAEIIVTSNLRDFPKRPLADHGVRALPADAIVRHLLEVELARATAALVPPAVDIDGHLERLRRAGLARSVKLMRSHLLG